MVTLGELAVELRQLIVDVGRDAVVANFAVDAPSRMATAVSLDF